MPTNNPTGKNQYTDNDKSHGKQAGASERSGSSSRSAGSRSDDRNKSSDSGKRGGSR